ncbi:YeeE/YedE family protein [Hwanghaeella grinnelliae]|uniref:YeeE/YedE family protein n=1 Tax=Hwanghaeella grinnelliae TaxID=2500179 RepID=A0A437QUI8_9PROT|nr:YeeE/YedE family protein [Hwanghaeella grinnelliae]RVU38168.1 YeeE/YedE family protein [Hwanghaeella grinnelliae]
MFEDVPIQSIVASIGAIIGLIFGYIGRITRFCTLSAVETAVYGEHWVQMRMWVFAIAVAILGTFLLVQYDLVDLSNTVHMLPRVAILGPILGGLIFGVGMAAVGTCGFGSALRAGSGDLRGLMTVGIIAIVGYMTIRGFLAIPRQTLIEPLSFSLPAGATATVHGLLALAFDLEPDALAMPVSLLMTAALAIWCLKDTEFRTNRRALFGSVMVGLLVVAGWFATGYIGADEFEPQPTESLSFVAAASSTLIYFMTFTGATISFGVGMLLGVFGGSFLAARQKNEVRLEGFDEPREMRRHIAGAILMGFGGVLSMGCSIGQGLTGVSTLAVPSFLALFSMWLGAALGLHILIHGWTLSARA